jgi:hypothetical protein
MHLFIGFIQLLLILTDSRFLPDMSSFWHQPVSKESSQSKSLKGLTVKYPTAMAGPLSFDIIQQTNNDKLLPTFGYSDCIKRGKLGNLNQPSPRVIHTSKLYLIFCQLKTEG